MNLLLSPVAVPRPSAISPVISNTHEGAYGPEEGVRSEVPLLSVACGETEAQTADSCGELEEERDVPGSTCDDDRREPVFSRSSETLAY